MMIKIPITRTLTLLLLILAADLSARDMKQFEFTFPAEDKTESANLDIDIGLARLQIKCHDNGDILDGDVRYDADKFRVDVDHKSHETETDIFLFSEQARRKLNLDSDDNDWRISLSREYGWKINMEIGFAECFFDFSGLSITDLSIDIGASECEIEFDRPNPRVMKFLDIDAGAGELQVDGLGNANFEEMRFDGGAGDFILNFEGTFEGNRSARIDVGVGALRLELPEDLPVRIETDDSWLNSISFRGARLTEVEDGVFETSGFGRTDRGLEIDLDLGIGEAEIVWVR